ncbi:MAG: hypothetical protein WDW36_007724 [Sanguina aurantia]
MAHPSVASAPPLHIPGLLLALLSLLQLTAAIKLILPPGKTECVLERVDEDHFQIPGGPRVDGRVMVSGNSQYYVPFITVQLWSPQGDQIWQALHVYSEAHFNVAARGPGSYKVCFTNPYESRSDAVVELVYFTLAHLRGGGGGVQVPKGTAEDRGKAMAHKDDMEGVKRTILGMSEFVSVIKGSQRYLTRKLERHEKTMISNKHRTMSFAGLEVAALISICVIQVFTIRQ